MELGVLGADEWQILRDVRLRALKDSPGAYFSDYEVEASWTEASWRSSFGQSQWIVARDREQVIGVARSVRVDGRPADERHVESVWVDPNARRTGVLRAILRHATEVEPEVTDWLVWVVDDNVQALSVYDHLGFRLTGERQPLVDGSGRTEIRLRFRNRHGVRTE